MEEECNTVTFVGADGMEQSFPLDFLLERGAIVANRVNGEDIMSVMGATNQLWVPGLPAKYFVRDIRDSTFDATFIKFVVELCHAVGISVCLEGVETNEEYEVVGGMGLDYIQGFLFGRPLPEEEFERRFLEGRA